MQYSFAEAGCKKGVYLVDMRENGQAEVSFKTLLPLHQMRCVKGKLAELIREDIVNAPDTDPLDYIQATLTDRDELVDPMSTLRSVYPHALQILLEKNHQVSEETYESRLIGERKGTEELFADFYEMLTGSVLDDEQLEAVREAAGQAEACL